MLKVGVIGVGYLGQYHARIFSELENVLLVGVVDIDNKRSQEIAQKYGCDPYTDFKDILNKVDAVSIVTPTREHFSTAIECIKAGKDILVEKPITQSPDEAELLLEEAERMGVIIQVGHLERYNPAVVKVYSLITDPFFFEAERLSPFTGRGTDVDVVVDLMIHDIDIILSILSRNGKAVAVKDIKAVAARVLTDKPDVAKAWFDFGDNIHAVFTASRVFHEKSRVLKIFQKDSHIILDYQGMSIKRFFPENGELGCEIIDVDRRESLKEELRDFVDCVITRRKPMVSAVEGMNALKAAHRVTAEGVII
jgi:predicted dehydrogenase